MKTCPRCNVEKPRSEFNKNKARKDGLSVYCHQCTKEYMADKQYDRERWERMREQESARNRAYREANADRLREAWRLKQSVRRKLEPGLVRYFNASRKKSQRTATPSWANKSAMQAIYVKAKEWSDILGVKLEVDHIVPINSKLVCGLHCEDNMQLLSSSLNNKKKHYEWPDMP